MMLERVEVERYRTGHACALVHSMKTKKLSLRARVLACSDSSRRAICAIATQWAGARPLVPAPTARARRQAAQ
jgi:hypothetical protein